MAVLAVAAVGGAVGSYFGSAAIGWTIGSIIGQRLFAEDVNNVSEGTRLSDLKIQTSTYGRVLPITYGSSRIAGNVIWSSGINETRVEETQTQGGKGGPEVSSTTISYLYDASFAISFGEGPVAGISKIWADSKLIYDFSSTSTAEAIFSSTKSAEDINIYLGTETQTADSLIESYEGAGNVPGFRGQVYIVFEKLQLGDYGNRIPNITAEIVESATIAYAGPLNGGRPTHTTGNRVSTTDDGVIKYWKGGGATSPPFIIYGRTYSLSGEKLSDITYSFSINGYDTGFHSPVVGSDIRFGYYNTGSVFQTVMVNSDKSYSKVYLLDGRALISSGISSPYHWQITYSYYYNQAIYSLSGPQGTEEKSILKFNVHDRAHGSGNVVAEYIASSRPESLYAGPGGVYILEGTSQITRLDSDLNYVEDWSITWGRGYSGLFIDEDIAIVVSNPQATFVYWAVYRLNDDGTSTILDSGQDNYVTGTGDSSRFRPINVGTMVLGGERYVTTGLISKSSVTLSSIVSDICLKSGLESGDIDVTALTDSVDGYSVNNETSARALLEPLQQAFLFDIIESDNKIIFVKRGGGDVITVDSADLGASESNYIDLLPRLRLNELEIPKKLTIGFLNTAADYQDSIEYAARINTSSKAVETLSLPIAMSSDKAAQLAEILLRRIWIEREQYSGFLPIDYLKVNPSDILSVSINSATHTILIKEIGYSIPGIISFTGVTEDVSQYDSNATGGSSSGFPVQTAGILGPTNLHLLDIPLLRDQDNTTGYYVAACGYLSKWSTAILYKSNDSGDTWNNITTITNASIIGSSTDALSNGIYTIFDYSNTVNVRLINGTLSSSTEDAVLNGANPCLLGDEVLHFITATLEADGTYTLSGLLRGRKGTEWAMSTHAAYDRFIMLSETTLVTVFQSSDEIGLARDYKGVTVGNRLQTAASESFTNNAVRLKPLSPVHIAGTRDASDNLTITWIRRARVGATWRDYIDVPLDEDTQSYEVDIMSGATVLRTLTSTSQSKSYTAAQQTTDGLTPGDPVEVNIYQLSATVGRGYAGNATI